jgi:hypothetical protein
VNFFAISKISHNSTHQALTILGIKLELNGNTPDIFSGKPLALHGILLGHEDWTSVIEL